MATTDLDVRPVQPEDRFKTTMGAFEPLPADVRLHLVVDHDPKCMYYPLKTTRAADAFLHLEDGPEVGWVEVTRR